MSHDIELPPTPEEITMAPTVDFDVIDPENWIRYQLKDGTIVKVKFSVNLIKKLLRNNPDGSGKYTVLGGINIRVVENIKNVKNILSKNK